MKGSAFYFWRMRKSGVGTELADIIKRRNVLIAGRKKRFGRSGSRINNRGCLLGTPAWICNREEFSKAF
jgi:hypothetical protein